MSRKKRRPPCNAEILERGDGFIRFRLPGFQAVFKMTRRVK